MEWHLALVGGVHEGSVAELCWGFCLWKQDEGHRLAF